MTNMRGKVSLVELVKEHLSYQLKEWIGNDIPVDGTDDYEYWMSKLDDIEGIQTLADALTALYEIDESPEEALNVLGVVPADFTPDAGELYELLGAGLPAPPQSNSASDEETKDASAYWISNIGKILMIRWHQKLLSMGIDPRMEPSS